MIELYFFGGLFLAVFGTSLAFNYYNSRKLLHSWQSFADKHNLTVTQSGTLTPPIIIGKFAGIECSIHIDKKSADRDNRNYTMITASLGSQVPPSLTLSREQLFGKLAKFIGRQDIKIGHDEFDESFIVSCDNIVAARRLLEQPEIANAFIQLQKVHRDFHLVEQQLIIKVAGQVKTHDRLYRYLTSLADVAALIAQPTHASDGFVLAEIPLDKNTFVSDNSNDESSTNLW